MNPEANPPADVDELARKLHSDAHESIDCRVGNLESELLGMHRAAEQRARDHRNQAVGFVAGVIYTALVFYIIRR
jgi:hypothetical protein